MPIANMTNSILLGGAYRPLIEPIKKNHYRLLLAVSGLIPVLQDTYPEDSDYFETIKTSLVSNLYPLEVNFTPPAIQVEQRKIRGRGNVEVKYGGWTTYGNSEATFYNWIDLDTYKFFYRWASLAGAVPLFRNDDALQNNALLPNLPVADFAPDSYGGYKVNGIVSTMHTIETLSGDEFENARWILQGIFPTAVSAGDFNHADDGEPVLTNVSFSIDLALPAQSLHPISSSVTGRTSITNTIV